jgi:integrase
MAKREWISKEHKIYQMPNGRVYARPSIPGLGRKEFPLDPKAKSLTQMIRDKERKVAALLRQNEPKPKSLVRVEDCAEEIIRLKANRSEATLDSAKLHFRKHILPWFNVECPYMDQVDETVIEEYILAQQRKTPGRKLFNDVKHLRMLSQYAYRKGLLPRPLKITDPDPERDAGRRLSAEEVARLLGNASSDLGLQILMAIEMGMRKSEILLLSWDRVDMIRQTIHLRAQDTKIRRARTMGMSKEVYRGLERVRAGAESPFVFPSRFDRTKPQRANKTAWNACKRRAGVKARFHDLRHTFLSVALLERKLNPLHVAVYAGVSLQEIQRTYLHPSVEDTRHVALHWGKDGE